MRLLLDTHVFLWWLTDDARLGTSSQAAITDPRSTVVVSSATIWEASIKVAAGRLTAPVDLADHVEDEGFVPLPISLAHAAAAGALPLHHRDPFDRMLVAQARAEGLAIITADASIGLYDVTTVAA